MGSGLLIPAAATAAARARYVEPDNLIVQLVERLCRSARPPTDSWPPRLPARTSPHGCQATPRARPWIAFATPGTGIELLPVRLREDHSCLILGPWACPESILRPHLHGASCKTEPAVVPQFTVRIGTGTGPNKVMHDNGKQFKSKIFRRFLKKNNIKDKSIPARYPQLQGKIEAYNKIVKNEFLAVENISDVEEGKKMYSMFVKAYNEEREHGGINGYTPLEMFLSKGRLNNSSSKKIIKQIKESVTHVGK